MNKLIFTFIALFFLNNCSLNENSKIWNGNQNIINNNKNIKKVFYEEKRIVSEFNQGLKLDLSKIDINFNPINNQNNLGSQNFSGLLTKNEKFKFSKIEEKEHVKFKPIFFNDGIIYFDRKGTIIKYDKNKKIIWKKNYYTKSEKKLNPKLNFFKYNQNLIVADSISKYYSINLQTGKLNWSKYNMYPFNSDIKMHNDKLFVVDYKNTLRCYKVDSGSECWNLKTEDTFTISNSKYSLIIVNGAVIFSNSIGDITSVDINSGLINWQLPTQSNDLINQNFNFKISKLVSDNKSIYFSNNKNEFYSVDIKTGITNWLNQINSDLTPIVIRNLIFTISKEGYLYVIDKDKGNIIRITHIFKYFKEKKRNKISPQGFVIGKDKLYLTISNGEMLRVNLDTGIFDRIEKVSRSFISRPYIYKNNLYIVSNGSIVKYN